MVFSFNFVSTYFIMCILGSKSGRSFLDRCTAFIGENALECVKTTAFLNLPKNALIHLVSSDYVSFNNDFAMLRFVFRNI